MGNGLNKYAQEKAEEVRQCVKRIEELTRVNVTERTLPRRFNYHRSEDLGDRHEGASPI